MVSLRPIEVFNDSRFALIAVESVDFRHSKTSAGCQLYGNIEPIAVIVCSPDGTYALDIDAKPTSLDQLKQEIPELDAIVATARKG